MVASSWMEGCPEVELQGGMAGGLSDMCIFPRPGSRVLCKIIRRVFRRSRYELDV